MNELTIITVNYNSTDYLQQCVARVFAGTRLPDVHLVVVDNASRDRDFSGIRSRFPAVEFILNDTNLGFSKACNLGIRSSQSDFYLLLNPDCFVEDGAIDQCVEFLRQNAGAGIVGCRVNNPDGSLQKACRRTIPRPSSAFFRLTGLSRIFPRSPRFARYNLSYFSPDQTHEVEAVSGSFLMFRRQVLDDIEGLDESFFLYGEDLDFCYRAHLAGWKIFYFPEARVVHHKRRSSSRSAQRSLFHFYNAMEIFYRKHFYPQAGRLERAAVIAGIRLLYIVNRLRLTLFGSSSVGSEG